MESDLIMSFPTENSNYMLKDFRKPLYPEYVGRMGLAVSQSEAGRLLTLPPDYETYEMI
jgi:hypothetical protein